MTNMTPLFVDNTILKATARCTTEAQARHTLHLTTVEEAFPLNAGTAVHKALEVYLKGGSKVKALATLSASYSETDKDIDPNGAYARLTLGNVLAVVGAWIDAHPLGILPFTVRPELIEVGFALCLTCGRPHPGHEENCADASVIFCGRLDALVTDRDTGELFVLDHKTTGWASDQWLRQFRLDSQLSGYVWAAERHLGVPVAGAYINAIELRTLPTDTVRKCARHGVVYAECGPLHLKSALTPVRRSPQQVKDWHRNAQQLASRFKAFRAMLQGPEALTLREMPQEGTFHGACTYCRYAEFCTLGRPLERLSQMFIEQAWSPLEHAIR